MIIEQTNLYNNHYLLESLQSICLEVEPQNFHDRIEATIEKSFHLLSKSLLNADSIRELEDIISNNPSNNELSNRLLRMLPILVERDFICIYLQEDAINPIAKGLTFFYNLLVFIKLTSDNTPIHLSRPLFIQFAHLVQLLKTKGKLILVDLVNSESNEGIIFTIIVPVMIYDHKPIYQTVHYEQFEKQLT